MTFGEKLKEHFKKVSTDLLAKLRNDPQKQLMLSFYETSFHGQYEGFTEKQVDSLRRAQKVDTLPEIYRQFLLVMGKSPGGFFEGANGSFEALKATKKDLIKTLKDNLIDEIPTPRLPSHVFVFLSYQGVDYFFFETGHDDPAVYYYNDGDAHFRKVADHLSEWFFEQCLNHLEKAKASTILIPADKVEKWFSADEYLPPIPRKPKSKPVKKYEVDGFGERLKRRFLKTIKGIRDVIESQQLPAPYSFIERNLLNTYDGVFEGYTESEIEEVRQAQNVTYIPDVYYQFLQVMGKKAGGFEISRGNLNTLKNRKDKLIALLNDKLIGIQLNPPELPANAFVFYSDGSKFLFFLVEEKQNDPSVFYYAKGDEIFNKLSGNLTNFLYEDGIELPRILTDSSWRRRRFA